MLQGQGQTQTRLAVTIIARELSPIITVKDSSLKVRLKRLAQGFQDNLTGLNNSQTLRENIPNFNSCQTLLILEVHNKIIYLSNGDNELNSHKGSNQSWTESRRENKQVAKL